MRSAGAAGRTNTDVTDLDTDVTDVASQRGCFSKKPERCRDPKKSV
ncbi:hypothetical protein [Azospirillum largimobile]